MVNAWRCSAFSKVITLSCAVILVLCNNECVTGIVLTTENTLRLYEGISKCVNTGVPPQGILLGGDVVGS